MVSEIASSDQIEVDAVNLLVVLLGRDGIADLSCDFLVHCFLSCEPLRPRLQTCFWVLLLYGGTVHAATVHDLTRNMLL